MKFKSLIFGLLITGISLSVSAQKSAVIEAKENLDKYIQMSRTAPKLAAPYQKTAKEAIDKAIVHEKTQSDPELWGMRLLLYSEMAFNDSTSNSAKHSKEAYTALAKVKELDPQADTKPNVQKAKLALYQNQLLKGKKQLDKKSYGNAYKEFNAGLQVMPADTLLNYFAGVSAQNNKDYKSAIKNYSDLLSTNFSYLVDVYTNLGESYAANKDTATAIKIFSEGSAKFPKSNLASREIELSINSGRFKEITGKIEAQTLANPTNKFYPFYLGLAFTNLNEIPKAEEAYKKAIAIDPNFLEAYLNLGIIIMNNGIDTYNDANKKFGGKTLNAAQLAQYNAIKKKATADFEKALPYLTKATEINPKSAMALSSLRTYYKAKSNTAKVAEIDAKLKALQ
ncbi:MAG: tetratricopeptide repeat protein [Pyrinomonadaceae bacterium]|nr:tetratricopeptide repeat protein [Sphingobacteriaceae bacterium]